jgi:DNA polymerase III delta prime subunit
LENSPEDDGEELPEDDGLQGLQVREEDRQDGTENRGKREAAESPVGGGGRLGLLEYLKQQGWGGFDFQPLASKLLIADLREAALRRAAGVTPYLPNAYLFVGPEGLGQREAFILFAASLFCESAGGVGESEAFVDRKSAASTAFLATDEAKAEEEAGGQGAATEGSAARPALPDPCWLCRSCKLVASGLHPDVLMFEPEGPTYLVGFVRDAIIEEAKYTPALSGHRLFFIDEAERLADAAANALLRTLEEPPSKSTFVLSASPSASELLPTIVSRCRQVPFYPLSRRRLESLLRSLGVAHDSAARVAAMAGGVISRALTMLDAGELVDFETEAIVLISQLFADPGVNPLEVSGLLRELFEATLRSAEVFSTALAASSGASSATLRTLSDSSVASGRRRGPEVGQERGPAVGQERGPAAGRNRRSAGVTERESAAVTERESAGAGDQGSAVGGERLYPVPKTGSSRELQSDTPDPHSSRRRSRRLQRDLFGLILEGTEKLVLAAALEACGVPASKRLFDVGTGAGPIDQKELPELPAGDVGEKVGRAVTDVASAIRREQASSLIAGVQRACAKARAALRFNPRPDIWLDSLAVELASHAGPAWAQPGRRLPATGRFPATGHLPATGGGRR